MNVDNRSISYFLLRATLMLLAVLAPFVTWYLCADPFRVIYHYDEYYDNPIQHPLRIGINKGMVTVNTYRENLASNQNGDGYNAFIFGSSISCYYDAREWADMLGGNDSASLEARPFHFDSAAETPMSMARKVEYLYASGAPIDYAMLILDPIIMCANESNSPFAIDPPEFRKGLGYFIKYHYTFFRAATNADFFKNYIMANLTGKPQDIGHKPIYEPQPIVYDRHVNQESIPQWDSLISSNPEKFYVDHPLLPSVDCVMPGPQVIIGEKADAFRKIAEIFELSNTDCHIIVSPNRRGVSLSEADLHTLSNIFGSTPIHDFSTSHAHWLKNDTMLYDNTHYRPAFASKMMHDAYHHF